MMMMMKCKKIVPWLGILVVQLVCGLNIKFITYNMDSDKAFPQTMTDIIGRETVQNNPPDIYVVATQEQNIFWRIGASPLEKSFPGYKLLSMTESAYMSTRQFRLHIFQRNNCAYKVEVADTQLVVTSKTKIVTKGALLARVKVMDKRGNPVTEFVATSIHMNCLGAKNEHNTLTKAKAASAKAVTEQNEAWTKILDEIHTFARGSAVFISGDLNPRTMRIGRHDTKRNMSDADVYNRLNAGTLIFRAKHLGHSHSDEKNPQDGVHDPMYELDTLAEDLTKDLNRRTNWYSQLRENMLLGDTLRYQQHWIKSAYPAWVWQEEDITFYPTYKRKGSSFYNKPGKYSVPAFTDRHILLRPSWLPHQEGGRNLWNLSSYDSLETVVKGDHLPVVLSVEYSD